MNKLRNQFDKPIATLQRRDRRAERRVRNVEVSPLSFSSPTKLNGELSVAIGVAVELQLADEAQRRAERREPAS